MWTLGEARERLTGRVGEVSTEFWTVKDRNDAINDAQRFVAVATRGVPITITGIVSNGSRYLNVPYAVAGDYAFSGTVGDRAVTVVPVKVADTIDPRWRTRTGPARWVFVDAFASRVWVSPAPGYEVDAAITLAVTPPALLADNERLFLGNEAMSKYLGVVLNYAAAMLLLRERFDGDAERFYQIAVNELGVLGVEPGVIPAMPRTQGPQE